VTHAWGPVRVGIVGGGFAARSHVDALRRMPGIEIAAIAASTPERSRTVAEELALTPVADYRAMLENPAIDAVHDCTPNDLHFEVNEAAIAAGKHLLRIGKRAEPNRSLPRDPSLLSPAAAGLAHYPGGHQEGWPDALLNLCLDFYTSVRAFRSGEPHAASFATLEDAHRITQAVEAILASYADERWVRVGAPREVDA
jgi:predicted dehydrogenase